MSSLIIILIKVKPIVITFLTQTKTKTAVFVYFHDKYDGLDINLRAEHRWPPIDITGYN